MKNSLTFRRAIIFTLSLLITFNSFSQNIVKGKFVDKEFKTPVNYTQISLFINGDLKASTESDENGEFEFKNIANGTYSYQTSSIGYSPEAQNGITVASNTDLGTIELSSNLVEIEGVEVVGNKQQTVYKLDKKIISASSNIMSNASGTATDVLTRVPSVRIDMDGDLTFRGSTGFVVQINGKPSPFTASQTLQQIPASQIENIEIITTPSARNQSEGDGGIINIITKKSYDDGLSGVVNIYGSTMTSKGGDFTLSKRKGDNQFQIVGIYSDQVVKSDFEQEKQTFSDDEQYTSYSTGDRSGTYSSYTLQGGWQMDKENSSFYATLMGGYDSKIREGDLAYTESIKSTIDGSEEINNYNNIDFYDLHQTFISGTTGFTHNFKRKGETLTGYGYVKHGWNALENFRSDLYNPDGTRAQGHEAWEDEIKRTVEARLDYELPYSEKGKLEAGFQYYSYFEDGDYTMEYWDFETSSFDYRDDIYNTFYFGRNTYTLYLLANQEVGKFEFQGGLRAEYNHDILESSKEWANRTKNTLDFFPSAHVGYTLTESATITAAYSRRITRPRLFYMEPYITFRDYFTAEIGNPDIRSEYINVYEISLEKKLGSGNSLQATAFHRTKHDKIERLRVTYDAGITLDSMANVGSDYSTGVELSLNIKANRFWNFVVNGSSYYYELVNNQKELGGEDQSSFNFDLYLSNDFKIAKNSSLQVNGTYVGPTVSTQGEAGGYFYADLAFRQNLFKNRLTADLTFKNFLNTAKYTSNISTSTLYSYTTILPKFPTISLGISYVFNNFKQKGNNQVVTEIFEGTNY